LVTGNAAASRHASGNAIGAGFHAMPGVHAQNAISANGANGIIRHVGIHRTIGDTTGYAHSEANTSVYPTKTPRSDDYWKSR
jgi:hypothetical protein